MGRVEGVGGTERGGTTGGKRREVGGDGEGGQTVSDSFVLYRLCRWMCRYGSLKTIKWSYINYNVCACVCVCAHEGREQHDC